MTDAIHESLDRIEDTVQLIAWELGPDPWTIEDAINEIWERGTIPKAGDPWR